ncbi:MAG TPA: hypothetical protein VMZ91_11425 [Candidatus Paceibacterota bacterium]|nr:hypothetical protein [Candidatus Paceibacterota bacterium]
MYKIKVKIKGLKDINKIGNFIKTHNIKLVLFGEYHGFINQIQIQKKIIKNVKPDFFLYELLEEKKILNDKDAKKFLDSPDDKDFSVISTYGQLKPIIKLARNFDLPIIGCDIKNMGCKDKDWMKKKFTLEKGKMITKKRELRQSNVINKYLPKGLIFALLGGYHIRKNSLVLAKIKANKIIVINPLFKWEERFSHKKKFNNSEISYVVKLINISRAN